MTVHTALRSALFIACVVGCGSVGPVDADAQSRVDAPICIEVPTCGDGSCSRLTWDFDSANLDGVTARTPAGLILRVERNLGSLALAIDFETLGDVELSFPLCSSGAIDFSDKQLRFNAFFDGGNTTNEQYFVQVAAPSPMTDAFLGTTSVQAGIRVDVEADFGDSIFSNSISEFTVKPGTFGAAFSGTIYFDDFRIE